jgi:hypothetical protein
MRGIEEEEEEEYEEEEDLRLVVGFWNVRWV